MSTTKELQLRRLTIELNTYGDNIGKYTGSIEYTGSSQETKLTLDPLLSEELLKFIGPLIHKAAAKVADDIKINIQIALDNLAGARQIEAAKVDEAIEAARAAEDEPEP